MLGVKKVEEKVEGLDYEEIKIINCGESCCNLFIYLVLQMLERVMNKISEVFYFKENRSFFLLFVYDGLFVILDILVDLVKN